jgi:hypothetical protein
MFVMAKSIIATWSAPAVFTRLGAGAVPPAPSGNDYTKIYSTNGAFATLKADGSIKAWGDPNRGGTGAPAGSGYTKIYSTKSAFAAIKADTDGTSCTVNT